MHLSFTALCVFLWCISLSYEAPCRSFRELRNSNSTNVSRIRFSIISTRNQTGHWTAEVALDEAPEQTEEQNWELEVEQNTIADEDKERVLLVVTLTVPPRRPSPNYELVSGLGYYKLHTEPLTWTKARSKCVEEGAHLLILNSEDEFSTVKRIWDTQPKLFDDWRNDFVHIGISDLATEGTFVTIFGKPLSSTGYVKWAANEPAHGNTANCGRLHRSGHLYDSYCTNNLAFFCEQEM